MEQLHSRVRFASLSCKSNANVGTVPARPASQTSRQRQDETPSHPGGLSDQARKRLQEHRASRQRDVTSVSNKDTPRTIKEKEEKDHLASFRDRLNRNVPQYKRGDSSSLRLDRNLDDTPSGKAVIRNQAWDATPSSGGQSYNKTSAWESTPRAGGIKRKGEWDTPRADRDGVNGRNYPEEQENGPGGKEYEEEQLRLDRDWYSTEEDGLVQDDEATNPFAQYEAETREREKEQELKDQAAGLGGKKRLTARQAQYNADNELWESNRLAQSGATGARRKIDLDFDDEEESKVHLLTHDLKPPFLDGRMVFTKQLEPISPVKDPTSDLAVFSAKGSLLVREKRAQAEREKAAKKVAALGGTNLGNLLGVKESSEQVDNPDGPGTNTNQTPIGSKAQIKQEEDDARKDSKFATHMKARENGGSNFSRTKTLKEQRQYLPAFACREDLLKVIREHQGEQNATSA